MKISNLKSPYVDK